MASRALRVAETRTEHLLVELLASQGWDTRRPPTGNLLRQHEFKDYAPIADAFRGRNKTGGVGHGVPEAVLVDRETFEPIAVIEAKASISGLPKAIKEVTGIYGTALVDAGFRPLAIALAGTAEDEFQVRVFKWQDSSWTPVTYEGNPISWIPNRADSDKVRGPNASPELRPTVPPPEVLAARADEINRLLREASVKDDARPAVVGATMLAIWQSKGQIRKDPSNILSDINQACERAFWKARKPELAKSLRIDEANSKLAIKARRIVSILERLNVAVLTAEHDYLGQLYETFFRYTGGNTIGQYFTPRHIASFVADLCQVNIGDVVLDPACGTGGFLIAVMNRVAREHGLSRTQTVAHVKKKLIGFDDEPVTAALCVANMILRGDGSTGVRRGDCLTSPEYPDSTVDVVLMNPPFPHKRTDVPSERFIERGLFALRRGGMMAVIIPLSLLVKSGMKEWRSRLLKDNTLEAAIKLPDELFQPYAKPYTVILVLKKGIPHPKKKRVFFARVENDGFRLKKGNRIPCAGSELGSVLEAFSGHISIPGFCGWSPLGDDVSFAPGTYIPARPLAEDELSNAVQELARNRASTLVAHATQFSRLNRVSRPYWKVKGTSKPGHVPQNAFCIGDYFEIGYGQRELHNKELLIPGDSLVISSSGTDNGCYGFFDFDNLISPPFVTVPSTGSIGIAHVQEWPCGVTDDCLILSPKIGVPSEAMYIAASVIRNEAWRFSYGRKATPDRISNFPMPVSPALISMVREHIDHASSIENLALSQLSNVKPGRAALVDAFVNAARKILHVTAIWQHNSSSGVVIWVLYSAEPFSASERFVIFDAWIVAEDNFPGDTAELRLVNTNEHRDANVVPNGAKELYKK